MELMKKIILTACILCVIITIADCVKPCEKFTNQLKSIFALVFVSGIAAAAVRTGMDFELLDYFGENFSEGNNSISEGINRAVESQTGERMAAIAGDILKKAGVSYEKISCEINISEGSGISISMIGYKGDSFLKAKRVLEQNFPDTEVKKIE